MPILLKQCGCSTRAFVSEVLPNSAAEKAGIKTGDIITYQWTAFTLWCVPSPTMGGKGMDRAYCGEDVCVKSVCCVTGESH